MPKSKNPHYNKNGFEEPKKTDKIELDPTVKFIIEAWDEWDSYWGNKFSEFEQLYDRWKGKKPKRDEDWQANFHKKMTWQAEKVLVARYHSALFPTAAPIDTEAVETQDEPARILTKSMVAHWFKVGKFSKEFLSGMRSSAIYGTGLFEDDWYVRKEEKVEKVEKQIPDYKPMVDLEGKQVLDADDNPIAAQVGVKTITQEQKRLVVVEDRYRVRKANIFAWRIHPNKLTDDDDYPVIKQEYITFDDLLEMQAESEKYGVVKFDNIDKLESERFAVKPEELKRLQKGDDKEFSDKDNPRIELLYYWGKHAEGKEKKKPMWICVANRKYALFKKDNPYWHKKPSLFHIVWTEDERPSYYGIGVAEIGADAEDRANTSVNTRIDMYKKNVRGSGWYNALDKKIKKSQLQSNIPGLMRACSDPRNAVIYDNPPSLRPEDYKEEETTVNDHREITGATTSLLPTADVGQQHKTLGGMELLVSQGTQRLKPDLSMMELMGIRKMAERGLILTRQFMTRNESIELLASESELKQASLSKIYSMTPKQLMGGVNFITTGLSESIDKMQNIDKALKFMEILQKATPGHPFVNYLIKRIALWLGFEDADVFFGNMNNQTIPMTPQQMPNQIPGVNIPGQPMGGGVPIPTPNVPMMPPQQGIPGQGLPPQLLALIAQQMQNRGMR